MQRRHKAPSAKIALVLNLMAEKLRYTAIMREAKVSTTVVEKVIGDFPLWSYYLRPPRKPQEKEN